MNMKLLPHKLFGFGRVLAISVPLLAMQSVAPTVIQPLLGSVEFGAVNAQEAEKEQKTKRTQAMNNKVYEKLQEAQAAVEAKNFPEAFSVLDELTSASKPLNDAEMANVLNVYAFIYYTQEDYPKAIKAYRDIIQLEQAPDGTKVQSRYSLAQLYFVIEDYRNGVDTLLEWFDASTTVGANAYVLLSQGYYQLKEYDLALENVEIAINMYKETGKVPKENWYGLQRFLYYEKENYSKVVEILDELLVHYPKKSYWIQLSAMYGELQDESKQLAALETAYVQKMLTNEQELVRMAYLYLNGNVPYKAAKLLDEGVRNKVIEPTSKNLDLLGSSWRQAQEIEKAIPEMAKAASKAENGELWSRLCSVYLDGDQFKKAVDACDQALKKGGVKRTDTAYLVKGMAHFNLKEYKSARTAFNQAAKDERSEKYATQWISFMDKELERQKSLEEG
jgi:tetratricopeptide (TPR) repeat protein